MKNIKSSVNNNKDKKIWTKPTIKGELKIKDTLSNPLKEVVVGNFGRKLLGS